VWWSLGSTAAGLRLHKNGSGERGPGIAGMERAHQRVSRVADGKAELAVALYGARAQQRPRNRWRTSAGGGKGSRFACAERERERARELGRGRKWKREGGRAGRGVKRGAGARSWPENARAWARPRRGDHGREVRDTLTSGVGGAERGNGSVGESNGADRSVPRDRESEGERALRFAPIGGARLSGTEGAQAQARTRGLGLMGCLGLKWLFHFLGNFQLLFLFIFSRVFNSNSNQVSNSNQIKYVQQFKEYLGSI
jgi:hypothetical protein